MISVAVLSLLAVMSSTWSSNAFPLYSDAPLAAQGGKLYLILMCRVTCTGIIHAKCMKKYVF